MSMAASCPVTAGYLWTKTVGWYMTDGEISQEIDWTGLPYDKERKEGLEWFMDSLRKQSEAAPDSMEESVHFLWNIVSTNVRSDGGLSGAFWRLRRSFLIWREALIILKRIMGRQKLSVK